MALSTSGEQLSFSIIDSEMMVKAMRDSGYKSTTHALAELIDNSIESHATVIEVFGISGRDAHTGRFSLTKLAVLDNGEGMDGDTLRGSLRYGHGTRRERRGIGRFGLGLPNSSMSQAKRADVWSWQTGPTNALHTYLSLDDVEAGESEIPEPKRQSVPSVFLDASRNVFGDSGTLVVWSDLDRVEWKQASTTFKHTELLVGRIYRRFLARQSERLHPDDPREQEIGSRRTITLIPIRKDGEVVEVQENDIVEVRPNDPLYLMSGTSCPEDFGPGPMFTELEGSPFDVPVRYQGQNFTVVVRASYARAHVRDSSSPEADWPEGLVGRDAGRAPWGKHADQNMGVSLVRAHREIQLDDSWVSGDDPRERWWTVEVDFPTPLDEVFGVTNNKQGTMTFQRLARFDWRREALPDEESSGDVRRRMEEEGDHRSYLLDLRKQITNAIQLLRARSRQARQTRGRRHVLDEDQKADARATAAITRRMQDGYEGESDIAGESGSAQEHREAQVESLTRRHHFDQTGALQVIDETLRAGNRVRWIQSAQSSPAFFDVESLPNVIQVALNTSHPVHSHLYDIMHPDVEEMADDEVRERLAHAAAAFRILIYSWARYEDEQADRNRRRVRDARLEWGKYAEEFFEEDDDSVPPTDLF
ncbi:MAG: ATP-binding protein [Gammaproteobacteria bacterium]|nr:ATP-binding protein [Gammaproteobacteria bacterium]